MIPRVTPQLPFLLVLGDELRRARAARQDPGSRPGDPTDGDRAAWVRPITQAGAEAHGDASYVFTPANPAA
ncbi:MAG: hypothetical protein ACRDJO_08795 [Actinomycetota bacterium]